MTLRRFLIVAVTMLAAHAALATPCETQYRSAVMALAGARLPEGTHQKIATKIANAWRIFSSGSTQSKANAVAQLDQAKKLLDGAAVKNVPVELRNDVAGAIDAFLSCIAASTVKTVPVTVLVFTGETAAGPGSAAGGGVTIRLDGDEAGKTKPDGTATINVPLGVHHFTAEQLPDWNWRVRHQHSRRRDRAAALHTAGSYGLSVRRQYHGRKFCNARGRCDRLRSARLSVARWIVVVDSSPDRHEYAGDQRHSHINRDLTSLSRSSAR